MTNFKNELGRIGCTLEPEDFYKEILTLFKARHPDMTDEEMKRRPKLALQFCDFIRDRLQFPALEDHIILGALENARKRCIRVDAIVA
jgi:hypothetical protein